MLAEMRERLLACVLTATSLVGMVQRGAKPAIKICGTASQSYNQVALQMVAVEDAATTCWQQATNSAGYVLTKVVRDMLREKLKFSMLMVVRSVMDVVKQKLLSSKWITLMVEAISTQLKSRMVMPFAVEAKCTSGSETTTSHPASEFFVPIAT